MVAAFEAKLSKRQDVLFKNSIKRGIGIGSIQIVIFFAYGLCLWFGAHALIIPGRRDGGDIMTAFFAVLIGTLSIGQAAPSVAAFATGRAAGKRVFELMKRFIDNFPPRCFYSSFR